MGNHDAWFAFGLPRPRPAWMTAGEAAHHRWTHAQLGEDAGAAIRSWPYELSLELGGASLSFLHYARTADGEFDYLDAPTPGELASLFAAAPGDLVLFGHDHRTHDGRSGGRRFVCSASAGCHDHAVARGLVVEAPPSESGDISVERVEAAYADATLFADLESRLVPERGLIRRVFFPRPARLDSAGC
jgi:hypothetical protein